MSLCNKQPIINKINRAKDENDAWRRFNISFGVVRNTEIFGEAVPEWHQMNKPQGIAVIRTMAVLLTTDEE